MINNIYSSAGILSSTPWYGQIGKLNSIMTSRAGKEVFHHSFDCDFPTLVVVTKALYRCKLLLFNRIITTNTIMSFRHNHHPNQVGVFVNSVPARVKMTVDEIGNLRFKNSSPDEDNLLTHEHLKELNLKQGENAAW